MIITYFGKQFFKIQQGEMTLAFNPVSKNSKADISTRFGADLALISTNHPDYNGQEQLFHGDRAPFVISGPGDYEVRNIFIKGLLSNTEIDKKKYINTIYSLAIDGINLVFLGALGEVNLSKEVKEAISEPDIIFVSVESNGLDIKSLAKLVFSLEPKMIIPMDYSSTSLKSFLKEMEAEESSSIEKLTLKKKDLENKKNEVVVLKPN